MHAHLVLDHPVVIFVSVTSVGPQLVSNQILWSPLAVGKTAGLEVIVLVYIDIAMPQDLGFRTEVLLLVLREVVYGPLVPVQGAQILVVIRILVIIKRVHPLICAIDYL